MKLGCASWGFRELKLEEYFEAVASMGLKYVEVECFNEDEAPGHIPSGFTAKEMLKLRTHAQKMGLKIVSFAGGNDFTVEDISAIAADIDSLKKMIDLAHLGGVEFIRVFAGWIEDDKITDATFAQVIDGLRNVGEYAKSKDVVLALENHGGITGTPDQMRRILDGVNLSSVKLNYDPANYHHCGTDPLKALNELKDYIVYVHLKDSIFENGMHEFKAVGDGQINWPPIIDWLNTAYEGYGMIEYENADDVVEGTKQSLIFLKGFCN